MSETAEDLARQVREAEALVKRLGRGEPATIKDSAPVRRGGKYGTGPGLIPMNSHPGGRGKSLIEKIRDDLRETIGEYEGDLEKYGDRKSGELENQYLDGLIDGICHALGILRDNEGSVERQWAEAEWRETERRKKEEAKKNDAGK